MQVCFDMVWWLSEISLVQKLLGKALQIIIRNLISQEVRWKDEQIRP